MAVKTGKVGKIYTIRDSTAFTTEATTEDGATMIYQIDDVTMRVWDINTVVTLSVGAFDESYYDKGVNYFEGKVKLLTTGEGALTVTGAYLTINEIAKAFGWSLDMSIATGEDTSLGEAWNSYVTLGKSASVSVSRYRHDQRFSLIENGYQECGLEDKALTTASGLATATQYYFKANIDGAGVVEEDFTTAADVTYAAVLALINATLAAGANFELINGDLRCTSDLAGSASTVALSAGTTGTDLFATLTDFTAFQTAVVGSENTNMFLLKLYEDATYGYICNAIRTGLSQTKSVGAVDQESTTFEATSQVARF